MTFWEAWSELTWPQAVVIVGLAVCAVAVGVVDGLFQ